jgi:hypothetical protein
MYVEKNHLQLSTIGVILRSIQSSSPTGSLKGCRVFIKNNLAKYFPGREILRELAWPLNKPLIAEPFLTEGENR